MARFFPTSDSTIFPRLISYVSVHYLVTLAPLSFHHFSLFFFFFWGEIRSMVAYSLNLLCSFLYMYLLKIHFRITHQVNLETKTNTNPYAIHFIH